MLIASKNHLGSINIYTEVEYEDTGVASIRLNQGSNAGITTTIECSSEVEHLIRHKQVPTTIALEQERALKALADEYEHKVIDLAIAFVAKLEQST